MKNILNKYENTILITDHLHTDLAKYNYEKIGNFHSVNVPSVSIYNQDGECNDNGIGYMLEAYDGKAKMPSVKVIDVNGKTVNKKYYTVTYDKGRKSPANIRLPLISRANIKKQEK